jgi:hypothetical protein
MKAYINRHIFTQTTLDSAALTQLGAVVRNFPEPSDYLGTIFHQEQPVGRFYLSIDDNCPATQVNVDLATVGRERSAEGCSDGPSMGRFVVSPEGYVVFHVSRGAGGFAVTLAKAGRRREQTEELFDSRELKLGDLFAVTLIRPGRYSVRNLNTRARGEIVVAYPRIGREPFRPGDPVAIRCTNRAFEPSSIRINAAQGQAYNIQTESPTRIKIELVEPDDGPAR